MAGKTRKRIVVGLVGAWALALGVMFVYPHVKTVGSRIPGPVGAFLAGRLPGGAAPAAPGAGGPEDIAGLVSQVLGGEAEPARVLPVRGFRVVRQDFRDLLPTLGTVKGDKEIDLKFSINGTLETFNFREGELIQAGEVIARLDQRDALLKIAYTQLKMQDAQTGELAAQKKREIHQQLYDIGAIIKPRLEETELELQSARLQVETLRAELEVAHAELDKTLLSAPQDGVLGIRDAEVGEFVTPNDRVGTLLAMDDVYAEIGVIEQDIQKLRLGQRAQMTVDAYPEQTFGGDVDSISPVVEGSSRTLTARIKVPNTDAERRLLPGMFARVEIGLAEFSGALLVPSISIHDVNDDGVFDTVFVVDEEHETVSARPVEVEYQTSDYTVLRAGVAEGELVVVEVVTEEPTELADGNKVRVVDIQEGII